MRPTFRAKLFSIVGIAALGFVVLIATRALTDERVEREFDRIERQYLPKVALRPNLLADFERLSRAFQDAVAAQDADALDATREIERRDEPSTSMERIWTRLARGSLFMPRVYEISCLPASILFTYRQGKRRARPQDVARRHDLFAVRRWTTKW